MVKEEKKNSETIDLLLRRFFCSTEVDTKKNDTRKICKFRHTHRERVEERLEESVKGWWVKSVNAFDKPIGLDQ